MAGRILPIALATILGISIGVATFDGEFKEQRRKKLEEEYKQEVAAASSLSSASAVSLAASTAVTSPPTTHIPAEKAEMPTSVASSSRSSMLGLWAWDKNAKKEATPAIVSSGPTKSDVEAVNGKP